MRATLAINGLTGVEKEVDTKVTLSSAMSTAKLLHHV